MPRPMKNRKVCKEPMSSVFKPSKQVGSDQSDAVVMTIEEFEVVRLMDYEKHNQTSCAEFMGVARSTVQRIYEIAREKIATSLVEGRELVIKGGHYRICENQDEDRSCCQCSE